MANTVLESDRHLKFLFGDIETKQKADGRIYISGYASTNSPDLEGEIIEPQAFQKNLPNYENNPIYCFNHDKNVPIGRVNKMSITAKGLYLDEVVLSKTKLVKDLIGPLVLDKVLTQQSVGFFSLKGKREGNYYKHLDVFLVEASLVSVACNTAAVLDAVQMKGLPLFKSVEDYIEAYDRGELEFPSNFYMENHYNEEESEEDSKEIEEKDMKIANDLSPDFRDIEVLQPSQKDLVKLDKSADSKQADNEELTACIFLAKSNKLNTYMFKIGETTEKGYRLSWDNVALNVGRLFGAKGEYLMDAATKSAILERIGVAYNFLNKQIPEYNGIRLTDLDESVIESLKYYDITFFEDEKDVIWNKILENDISNLIGIFEKVKEDKKELAETTKEKIKSLYPYFTISLSGDAYMQEDYDFVKAVIEMCNSYKKPPSKEDMDMAMTHYSLSDDAKLQLEKVLDAINPILIKEETEEIIEISAEEKKLDEELFEAINKFYKK